jgi:hypothetical protein
LGGETHGLWGKPFAANSDLSSEGEGAVKGAGTWVPRIAWISINSMKAICMN